MGQFLGLVKLACNHYRETFFVAPKGEMYYV